MAITEKYPITLRDRLDLGPEAQYFPGTMEEFMQLAEVCEYPVEYQNGIIVAMSIASDVHEQIVANLLYILVGIFKGNEKYRRYGSNRHIYLPEFECAYAPDASVVKGEPEIYEYSPGKTANQNPWLVVEVLSDSTRSRDYGDKLPRYKKTGSLEHIIFVEQDTPLVTVFNKVEGTSRWTSTDYNDLGHTFDLAGQTVKLADIYDNIRFE